MGDQELTDSESRSRLLNLATKCFNLFGESLEAENLDCEIREELDQAFSRYYDWHLKEIVISEGTEQTHSLNSTRLQDDPQTTDSLAFILERMSDSLRDLINPPIYGTDSESEDSDSEDSSSDSVGGEESESEDNGDKWDGKEGSESGDKTVNASKEKGKIWRGRGPNEFLEDVKTGVYRLKKITNFLNNKTTFFRGQTVAS